MKSHRLVLLLLASFGFANLVACAANPDNQETLRVLLTLSDGSQVRGVPALRELPLQTSYAAIQIPLDKIREVTFGEDHAAVTLVLANGDRLTASTSLKELKLEAMFGKITVPVAVIRRIVINPAVVAPPQKRGEPPVPNRRRTPSSRVVFAYAPAYTQGPQLG